MLNDVLTKKAGICFQLFGKVGLQRNITLIQPLVDVIIINAHNNSPFQLYTALESSVIKVHKLMATSKTSSKK